MSKLLALDQASHITGWSVFENGKLKEYGKISAEQSDIGDRLHYIKQEILKLISKYNIDDVVFEDIQLQSNVANNVATFKILAELIGVLVETFNDIKMPNSAILASSWKSTLGIKGKNRQEQKKNAQIWVQETYGIKVIQDIADSVALGTAYLRRQEKDDYDWN